MLFEIMRIFNSLVCGTRTFFLTTNLIFSFKARPSLVTIIGVAISQGCQTIGNGDPNGMTDFMKNVPSDFKGTYYLRSKTKPQPATSGFKYWDGWGKIF